MALVIAGASDRVAKGYFFKVGKFKRSPESKVEVKFLAKDNDGDIIITDKQNVSRKYSGFGSLKGHLTDIILKPDSGKGYGAQYQFNIVDAAGETMMLMLPADSFLTQGLLNCLASIEEFGELEFSAYIDKEERAKIWLKNDGEDAKWKVPYDEIPKGEPIMTASGKPVLNDKGEQQYDYSAKMEWFDTELVPLIREKLKRSFAAISAKGVEIVADDDLPY